MRKAKISMYGKEAGFLIEHSKIKYSFQYVADYLGEPISLTLPVRAEVYVFDSFPTFFEGLLPEGYNRHQLLKLRKIDANDYFSMLVYLGKDVVGATTITELIEHE